jgi:hypothetical protein
VRSVTAFLLAGSLLAVGACGDDDAAAPSTTVATTVVDTTVPADEDTTTTAPTEDGGESAADTTTTTSLGPPTLGERSTISTVGLDRVTFGMRLADAEAAAGTPFVAEGPVGRCTTYVPEEAPAGLRFTVVDGAVERIDVTDGPVTTRSGVGVGAPVQLVRDRYADRVESFPRADGSGEDLVFVPRDEADAAFRVIFETDGTTVTRYRAGRVPVVVPPEPCATVQLPAAPTGAPSSS